MTVSPLAYDVEDRAARERPRPWPMPQGGNDMPNGTCSVGDCGRARYCRGWCTMHYQRWRHHGDPTAERPNPVQRFWQRVGTASEDAGCWPWQTVRAQDGYGRLSTYGRAGRDILAHRFAYELLVGPIPDGLVIDHLCRNRACVNPAHLEPVTHRVNILRGVSGSAVNARKTHCIRGHPFDETNTIYRANGRRVCRTCYDAYERKRRAKVVAPVEPDAPATAAPGATSDPDGGADTGFELALDVSAVPPSEDAA